MFRAKWTPDVRLPRSGKWRRPTRTASHMEGTRLREKADEENWTAVPRLGCRCGFLRGFLRHIESVVTFCQNKGLFGRKLKTDRTEHDVRESSNCRRSRKARKIQRPSLRASAARVCAIASAADEVRRKRSTRPPPWPTNTRCASRHVSVRRVHASAARDRSTAARLRLSRGEKWTPPERGEFQVLQVSDRGVSASRRTPSSVEYQAFLSRNRRGF